MIPMPAIKSMSPLAKLGVWLGLTAALATAIQAVAWMVGSDLNVMRNSGIVLAMALAPLLTSFCSQDAGHLYADWNGLAYAFTSGLLIAVSGFFGDINLSAVKRDADVKDSGTLLPGQGGVLDRIDSLTFTAPVFYCVVLFATN